MLKIFEYENSPVQFEVIDGQVMANATVMCKLFGKRPNDWLNLAGTKRYIEAVTRKNGNAEIELVTTKTGGDTQGTWVHEKIIIKLAQWLDVDFEVWCDEKLAEIIKAESEPQRVLTVAEMLLESAKVAVAHEQRLLSLEAKVTELVESKRNAHDQMLALPLSSELVPAESERRQTLRLVNSYCDQTGISQHDTWTKLYSDLYYKYGISIRSYKHLPGEKTYFDIANRLGHVGKIKAMISSMIKDLK